MCGIAGFSHRETLPDSNIIHAAVESLRHRGPDQHGIHVSPRISLGAVRLKVIDLAGGDQPFQSEDGRAVIVFNGEVYNHREIRRDLENRGYRFRSQCDTEVALNAFLEWDTKCFSRLRGMFAMALWRPDEQRLVLARDRLGIKPLYICSRGREIHFGSELKALFAHPAVERRIDLGALESYLSVNYVPGDRTLVEGIRKLPAGCYLEWRDGQTRVEPYWQLRFRPDPHWTLAGAHDALDALLADAVREHLIADVPVGVWLSGGLDSSTILHYAAQAGARLKTFSVSFLGRSFDESRYFRGLAAEYGTEHHEFDLDPEANLPDAVEQFATYSDEPNADGGALPLWYLSGMSRRHVVVTLSGEGADELFGGYVTYRADALARRFRAVPLPVRNLAEWAASLLPVSDEKIGLEYKLKRFLGGCRLPPGEAHVFWNGTFSNEQRRTLLGRAPVNWARDLYAALPPGSREPGFLNQHLWFDQLYFLPDDILNKVDRISMAHSVEVRPPFLDHRIVEFAASLPEGLKVRGSELKYVLRTLMRGKLPSQILRRPKEGFDMPAHEWLRGPLRPMLLDTLSEDAVRRSGLLEWRAVEGLVRAHMERRANVGYHLWGLLILFQWIAKWGIRTDPRLARQASLAASSPATSLLSS